MTESQNMPKTRAPKTVTAKSGRVPFQPTSTKVHSSPGKAPPRARSIKLSRPKNWTTS